jgi:RES domain-containing protein
MRLWRLTRMGHEALDGAGAARHGGRYSPPGVPVVSFASEAGLAVLVALRYLPAARADWQQDHVLGWTEVAATPRRPTNEADEDAVRADVAAWLAAQDGLLMAIRSRVLPEADVVLMNPAHPMAAQVAPLVCRPFSFTQALHTPPMAERYVGG